MLGELEIGHDEDEGEMGGMDGADALDEDTDLFDSDYDLSSKVDDDDRLFDDFVDDSPTSDIPINTNIELSASLSGSSDEGESDIMDIEELTIEEPAVDIFGESGGAYEDLPIQAKLNSFVNSQSAENKPQTTLPMHNPLSSLLNPPQYTNGPTMYTQLQMGQSATSRSKMCECKLPYHNSNVSNWAWKTSLILAPIFTQFLLQAVRKNGGGCGVKSCDNCFKSSSSGVGMKD
ncbi:hypothetical protein Salat_1843800 [Sesamum alatum]|uniref:Uncharacterized protein n=1 Tax=Sesamum alatum TaxID=300844 RepID=A0AAE2CHR2_9LAMI|nr:hypothetical protein Salat_1843800 [Sesamum alatum]